MVVVAEEKRFPPTFFFRCINFELHSLHSQENEHSPQILRVNEVDPTKQLVIAVDAHIWVGSVPASFGLRERLSVLREVGNDVGRDVRLFD